MVGCAASAGNVTGVREGILLADLAEAEGLGVDHASRADVEALATSSGGLARGTLHTLGGGNLAGESSGAELASTTLEGELASRALDTSAARDGRGTSLAGGAEATERGRESSGTELAEATRVRVLANRALGAHTAMH